MSGPISLRDQSAFFGVAKRRSQAVETLLRRFAQRATNGFVKNERAKRLFGGCFVRFGGFVHVGKLSETALSVKRRKARLSR
jgi:hypothetical protein